MGVGVGVGVGVGDGRRGACMGWRMERKGNGMQWGAMGCGIWDMGFSSAVARRDCVAAGLRGWRKCAIIEYGMRL